MINMKKHETHDGKVLLAIVDSDLIDKTFEEGDLVLDFTSNFYAGEKVDFELIKKEIPKANNINACGIKIINFLKENDIISDEEILKINNIPYTNLSFYEN